MKNTLQSINRNNKKQKNFKFKIPSLNLTPRTSFKSFDNK